MRHFWNVKEIGAPWTIVEGENRGVFAKSYSTGELPVNLSEKQKKLGIKYTLKF